MSTHFYNKQRKLGKHHSPLDRKSKRRLIDKNTSDLEGELVSKEEAIKGTIFDVLDWVAEWTAEDVRILRPCQSKLLLDTLKYNNNESNGKPTYESASWAINTKLAGIQLSCRDAYPEIREKISLLGTWIDKNYDGKDGRLNLNTIDDMRTEISDKIEEIFG
jgi:hypothetical protein